MDIASPIPEFAAYPAAHPGTRFVDAVLFDRCGTAIGKGCPLRDATKIWTSEVAFRAGIITLDALGACWDDEGIGFSDGDPDAISYPVPGALAPVLWLADRTQGLNAPAASEGGTEEGEDPRSSLTYVVAHFADLGLTPVTTCALEFHLVDPARPGRTPDAPCVLAFDTLNKGGPLLAKIDAACIAQGLPAGAATAEDCGARVTVHRSHLPDPVLAADHALMLRRIITRVAQRHGLEATVLSKPFAEQSGSGLHIHVSLIDAEGRNLFDDRHPQGDVLLGHAIAGLQATTYDAMAIFAPNLNAYRRFAPNQFVPVNTSWGVNNRSVSFRVPAGGGAARRIEHRIAGAEANPYLVMAALLAGLHHGLTHRLTPTPPSTGNAGEAADPEMPLKLWAALDRREGSARMAGYLGPRFPAAYATNKPAEFEAFMANVGSRDTAWSWWRAHD